MTTPPTSLSGLLAAEGVPVHIDQAAHVQALVDEIMRGLAEANPLWHPAPALVADSIEAGRWERSTWQRRARQAGVPEPNDGLKIAVAAALRRLGGDGGEAA